MTSHWLDCYGSRQYLWQSRPHGQRTLYFRPLGLMEHAFDSDGRYYEGRADINAGLTLDLKSTIPKSDVKHRILLAWAALRCRHPLLQANALHCSEIGIQAPSPLMDMHFTVDVSNQPQQAVADAQRQLVFLGDHFDKVDHGDFWLHAQNTARVIDPKVCLAKLFVYPLETRKRGRYTLRVLFVKSHAIADGLSSFVWHRDFIHLLNLSNEDLYARISSSIQPDVFLKDLPLPQEALYPPITGSQARRRWFWLLTRILRHVRKPLPAGFTNPLLHVSPSSNPIVPDPNYAPILDYTKSPPLGTIRLGTITDVASTSHLHRLCREANASIGSGCFALAALLMMEAHEALHPDIPLNERKPFITAFPLNPRPFFNHTTEPNSLMLAFSDGICLPFLPSHLPLDGRLRLIIRQAHRQLTSYQKRKNRLRPDEQGLQYMGPRGTGRLLAVQYLNGLERMQMRKPAEARQTDEEIERLCNPQGAYPMRPNGSMHTCGISSVGNLEAFIRSGMYDVEGSEKDFVVDFMDVAASVRPRDEEFLVGCSGSRKGLGVGASVDCNAIDLERAKAWIRRFETVLKEDDKGRAEAAKL